MKADVINFTDGAGAEHTALVFNRNEHGADIIYIREPRLLSTGNWQEGLERKLNHDPETQAAVSGNSTKAPEPVEVAEPEPQAAVPTVEQVIAAGYTPEAAVSIVADEQAKADGTAPTEPEPPAVEPEAEPTPA